jgi:hypothetical protein
MVVGDTDSVLNKVTSDYSAFLSMFLQTSLCRPIKVFHLVFRFETLIRKVSFKEIIDYIICHCTPFLRALIIRLDFSTEDP